MDDVGVDQCIQALEGNGGCVMSELGGGVLKDAVIGPHQVSSWSISKFPLCNGFDLLASYQVVVDVLDGEDKVLSPVTRDQGICQNWEVPFKSIITSYRPIHVHCDPRYLHDV